MPTPAPKKLMERIAPTNELKIEAIAQIVDQWREGFLSTEEALNKIRMVLV